MEESQRQSKPYTPQRKMTRPLDPHEVYPTIRWYLNHLENLAISAYFGDDGNLEGILHNLEKCVEKMYFRSATRSSATHCPWPLCPDGVCAPRCWGVGDQPQEPGGDQ